MTESRPRAWNSSLPAAAKGLARTPFPRQVTSLERHAGLRSVPGAITARPARRARYTGPTPAIRALVLERDGWACVCCGVSIIGQPYSLQHRKRRSQGGDNSPSNLVTVLGTGTTGCHERIDSRRDPHDEACGYTVRSWDDPALIPVMIAGPGGSGCLVWLSATGTYLTEPPEEVA